MVGRRIRIQLTLGEEDNVVDHGLRHKALSALVRCLVRLACCAYDLNLQEMERCVCVCVCDCVCACVYRNKVKLEVGAGRWYGKVVW